MYNLNRYSNNKIDCKMNADEECLKSWSKQNWSLTNSLETPMGPVFDERWKGKCFANYKRIAIFKTRYKILTKYNINIQITCT